MRKDISRLPMHFHGRQIMSEMQYGLPPFPILWCRNERFLVKLSLSRAGKAGDSHWMLRDSTPVCSNSNGAKLPAAFPVNLEYSILYNELTTSRIADFLGKG